jgi:hypothetical protein
MYPYSACVPRVSPDYPSIGKILSEAATAGMAASLRPAITLTHAAGLPFRLTELNSVTCGGVAGISNTFATALWAPDALFKLVRAGVDAVNVHVRRFTVNADFVPTATGIVPRPLLYGLILLTRTLGPSPQLVDARVRVGPAAHLKVWEVRVGGDALPCSWTTRATGPSGPSVSHVACDPIPRAAYPRLDVGLWPVPREPRRLHARIVQFPPGPPTT